MTEQFKALDKDHTGMISFEELKEYILEKKIEMENEEIKNMIQALDYKGNGKLNYS